jgi:hypothetical protein
MPPGKSFTIWPAIIFGLNDKKEVAQIVLHKHSQLTPVLILRDISRLVARSRRRHPKTCKAVLGTSGWSPVPRTKPCGLSKNFRIKAYSISSNLTLISSEKKDEYALYLVR